MDGKLPFEEAKILEAISNGTMTKEKLEGGLIALINAEIEQNQRPANQELLDACQSLICRLHNCENAPMEREKSLSEAKKKLEIADGMRTLRRNAVRVAAVVVLIIGCSTLVDMLIRREYLTDHPTEDEQQYVIVGNVVEGRFVETGLADDNVRINVIGSSEINKVALALGYSPDVPTWLPEGWEPLDYYASTSQYTSVFRIQYSRSGDENLIKYSESRYADVAMALSAFEQSKNGEEHTVGDRTVYVAYNLENTIAVWLMDTTCYSVSGPVEVQEIVRIIEALQRSGKINEE